MTNEAPPKDKGRPPMPTSMLVSTIIMAALAATLLAVGYSRGKGEHLLGMEKSLGLLIGILPLLLCAFIVAGMVEVLIPKETLAELVGRESGFKGILIGSLAGGLAPGGPFVSLPIALGFLKAGAGVGPFVAFLTGWSLIAVSRLPMEVGILGWKPALVRLACTFFFAPIAGLIAHALFGGMKLVEMDVPPPPQ